MNIVMLLGSLVIALIGVLLTSRGAGHIEERLGGARQSGWVIAAMAWIDRAVF